jgi:hypothetical protein
MPGARARWTDSSGRISPVWLRFLEDLYQRTGGGAFDKVDAANTTTVVNEERMDFNIDFDLR